MFSFKDEKDLYNSKALKKHATGVMETVDVAVGKLGELPELVPVLKSLGARHVKYGVAEAHCESPLPCFGRSCPCRAASLLAGT